MPKRTMLMAVAIALIATTAAPAAAQHSGLSKAEVDFGTCREVVATKQVPADAVRDYVSDLVEFAPGHEAELVIRAVKCRWLKAMSGDHVGGTRQPIIIHVGIAKDNAQLQPVAELRPAAEYHSLFTVTNSRALARAARAAAHARVYFSEDVRFWMGRSETCGEPVRTVIAVRDDRAPSFAIKGVVNSPGPRCETSAVGPTTWWTMKNDIASAFTYLERRQSVVVSDTQLEIWAARNTRLNRIVGTSNFVSDSAATGLITMNDRSPDATIVPHLPGA